MVSEHNMKSYGPSKFLLVPSEFLKVYNLHDYIYNCEVSFDGKTITYRRMRRKTDVEIAESNN